MKIIFRADASLQIGTGHVMRCLTLADALAARGADCQFVCREHPGNLIEFIGSKGYVVHALPTAVQPADPVDHKTDANSSKPELAHGHWLGATQAQDAQACAPILAKFQPDWLVVDHYALDASWELALKPHYRKLMVIDDLADREHACHVLLDQTFGRNTDDYRPWVPADCKLLCGSQFALLRPEFSDLRTYSLQRRENPKFQQILITMGGVDKDNITEKVLEALRSCNLPDECQIVVVMGQTAPWLNEVKQQAQSMPWRTSVLVGVRNMAQLMAESDLAIGAAGATSWERCCLGLPTLMISLAENQEKSCKMLSSVGAGVDIGSATSIKNNLPKILNELIVKSEAVRIICLQSAKITDGRGLFRIAAEIS